MDQATIKQRKIGKAKQESYDYEDDSDEEAAYGSDKRMSTFNVEGVDANMFMKQMSAPSTFVIILLIFVLFFLAYEFGNL